jgi:Enolase, C-terminal TIM barrel domain
MLLLRSDELIDMYKAFTKDFPVISIEDPFDQDDIEHSKKLTAEGVCQVPMLLVDGRYNHKVCDDTNWSACLVCNKWDEFIMAL